jgi:adenosine deaminase
VGLRSYGPQHALDMAKLASEMAKLTDQIVAYDIAGPEKAYPPLNYKSAFDIARSNDLPITIHAGEVVLHFSTLM